MPLLRDASPNDSASIASVHVASWRSTYRGLLPDNLLDSLSIDERTLRWTRILTQSPDDNFTLVLEHDDALIGFASGGPDRAPKSTWGGEVYAIYLLAEYHRRGLGRTLFEAATERLRAQNFDSWRVWVLDGNTPAQRFYAHLGGQPGERKTVTFDGEVREEIAYGWR